VSDHYDAAVERLLAAAVARCEGDERALLHFLNGLAQPVQRGLLECWQWQAHGGQREPEGDWRVWLLMAGRGFGKTRTGAEWICQRARETREARIALVGASREEVAKVMIEGPSGLIRVSRLGEEVEWKPSLNRLRFASGAEAFVYSAEAPEGLRGPEHHFAWADELAKWGARGREESPAFAGAQSRADRAWDNLMMGLRLGGRPRAIVTTTPRSMPLLRRVRALAGTRETHGRTEENAHLPRAFLEWAQVTYGGTRLGRQELGGELIEDFEGALLSRAVLERSRLSGSVSQELMRIAVGVDPPASVEGTCGIVVCGADAGGRLYVLADASLSAATGGIERGGRASRERVESSCAASDCPRRGVPASAPDPDVRPTGPTPACGR
jgi:phage terminase large subunit-like protein